MKWVFTRLKRFRVYGTKRTHTRNNIKIELINHLRLGGCLSYQGCGNAKKRHQNRRNHIDIGQSFIYLLQLIVWNVSEFTNVPHNHKLSSSKVLKRCVNRKENERNKNNTFTFGASKLSNAVSTAWEFRLNESTAGDLLNFVWWFCMHFIDGVRCSCYTITEWEIGRGGNLSFNCFFLI